MAKMTEDEREEWKSKLPPGVVLLNKCDHCGKPMGGRLFYQAAQGKREYCSNLCFETAEGTRGSINQQPKKENTMIDPTKKKTAAPAPAEEPKKKGNKPKADEPKANKADGPKANKGAAPIDPKAAMKAKWPKADQAPDAEPASAKKDKKDKKAAAPAPAPSKPTKEAKPAKESKPAKEKKAPTSTAGKVDWAAQNKIVEDRLLAGKALTIAELFDGTLYKDKSRILAFLVEKIRAAGKDVVRDTKARTIKVVKKK